MTAHAEDKAEMDRLLEGERPEIAAVGARQHGKLAEFAMPYGGPTKLSAQAEADPYGTFAKMVLTTGSKDPIEAPEGRRFKTLDEALVAALPDRVCLERPSAFYDPIVSELGVRIDGVDQDSVIEFCVSERWARIGERDIRGTLIPSAARGTYTTRKVEDVTVEPYWRQALSRQQRRAREARMRKAK